jgi:hypothetical protein
MALNKELMRAVMISRLTLFKAIILFFLFTSSTACKTSYGRYPGTPDPKKPMPCPSGDC